MTHDTTPVTSPYDRAIAYATAEGTRAGKAAASWYFDGNDDNAPAILRGIADGDPAILDTLPTPDLSGEWAGTLTGPELVTDALSEAGFESDTERPDVFEAFHVKYEHWFSDICDAYETAFSDAVEAEITRRACLYQD